MTRCPRGTIEIDGQCIRKSTKAEDIGMLTDALNMLKVVFDGYAYEIKEKHDMLFDEYDLVNLELYIKKIQKQKR